MLRSLHIENIAVVERADVEFESGLNVLTGETGAGKSIIIDALYAVLGGRTGKELIRTGEERCVASAVFDAAGTEVWCDENGVEPEDDELLVQRVVNTDGRSSCRVCGLPVTVAQLKTLGAALADIHGQNDGRLLLDESKHLTYLDAFSDAGEELSAYKECYARWLSNEKQIAALTMDEETRAFRAEKLTARLQELEKAQLKAGEEEELTARSELLRNAERLREAADGSYAALYAEEPSAVTLVGEARGLLSRAKGWSADFAAADSSLQEALSLLEDAAEHIRDVRERLDFSPEEFDRVEGKLALLRRLEKKYAVENEAALLALWQSTAEELENIEGSGEELERLCKKRERLSADCVSAAEKLTAAREKAGRELARRVENELKDLSMPSVRFVTQITPLDDGKPFGPHGADEVRFLMSANAGEEPGKISRIASGGELSRIMLALKGVFGEKDGIPTAVFDEIDTGVSGVAASRVGEKLSIIGGRKQVLCISHLPQIAAMADRQYAIEKRERGGRTYTTVTLLDREGREREIARLMGGDHITPTTLASASEALTAAEKFKARV